MCTILFAEMFFLKPTELYSADAHTVYVVVFRNHLMFASFWLIVNVCIATFPWDLCEMDSFSSLVRKPIPPLLRRWGWCSWDAHGVGVQRRHLDAMRHLETILLFGGDTCAGV